MISLCDGCAGPMSGSDYLYCESCLEDEIICGNLVWVIEWKAFNEHGAGRWTISLNMPFESRDIAIEEAARFPRSREGTTCRFKIRIRRVVAQ